MVFSNCSDRPGFILRIYHDEVRGKSVLHGSGRHGVIGCNIALLRRHVFTGNDDNGACEHGKQLQRILLPADADDEQRNGRQCDFCIALGISRLHVQLGVFMAEQFCDRDGARDAQGNPIGCGAPMPSGTYADAWQELSDPHNERSSPVRREGRFVPQAWTCSICGTSYYPNVGERMKANAIA